MPDIDGRHIQDGLWIGCVPVVGGPVAVAGTGVSLTVSAAGTYLPEPDEPHLLLLGCDAKLTAERPADAVADGDVLTGIVRRRGDRFLVSQTLARGDGAVAVTDRRVVGVVTRSAVDAASLSAEVAADGTGHVLVFTIERALLTDLEHRFGHATLSGACELALSRATPLGPSGEPSADDIDVIAVLVDFVTPATASGAPVATPPPAEPDPLPAPAPAPAASACATCGAPVRAGRRFCRSCGAPVVPGPEPDPAPEPVTLEKPPPPADDLVCRECAAAIAPGQRFCRACGARAPEADLARSRPAGGSLWATAPASEDVTQATVLLSDPPTEPHAATPPPGPPLDTQRLLIVAGAVLAVLVILLLALLLGGG